jgi:DUF4097 and DUF4098 domain-containing protein YvlB
MFLKNYKILLIICFALAFLTNPRAGEKKFNVSKGGKLILDINNGDIHINTWDKNQLVLKSEVEDDVESNKLAVSQNGNTINVNGTHEFSGSDLQISVPYEFNFQIETNAGTVIFKGNVTGRVEVKTSGGDIKTDNIYGSLDANTSGGNITTLNIKGQTKLNSGGGDIKVGDIEGDLSLKTGGGNVKVGKVYKTLKLSTGGGNISVVEIGNIAEVVTGGGNIVVDKSDNKIEITTGGGDIKLNAPFGEITARTGSGSIHIQNAFNKLNLSTGSGDAEVSFTSAYKGNSEIKNGNGNVILYLPANIRATITAKVDNWNSDEEINNIDNIRSDFNVSTIDKKAESGKLTAVYQINGGGANININVSNGNVQLKKR